MGKGITRRFIGIALAAGALLSVTFFLPAEPRAEAPVSADEPVLEVVATTAMIGDAVRAVGGDRVAVETLMGEGVDPHLYRQTQADIAAMVRADAVFWNGLYLEAQLEEFLLRLGETKPVFALGDFVPREDRIESPDYEGRFDPHIWMAPNLWMAVVEGARASLSELDPDGADIYAANAKQYLEEIERLERYASAQLATVPEDKRVLITAHDAFSYFGRAFDFEVVGIQGLSTESEAGLQQIDRLVDLILERDIGAIFVESSVPERNIRALIEGAAARGHEVKVGGELYSDAMGPTGSYEGSYVGMIDSNVTTVTRALGGDAPASGMNGRLAES